MISIPIKILLVLTLSIIIFQDIKERQVWAFLFLLFAILGGILFYQSTFPDFFWFSILINLGIVMVILLINFLFAKYFLKKSLFKEALGLGDVLFFMAFAVSFPTLTFINFFIFSLLCTFLLFWITKKFGKVKQTSIPLAGFMALFLVIIYLIYWLGFFNSMYVL